VKLRHAPAGPHARKAVACIARAPAGLDFRCGHAPRQETQPSFAGASKLPSSARSVPAG